MAQGAVDELTGTESSGLVDPDDQMDGGNVHRTNGAKMDTAAEVKSAI